MSYIGNEPIVSATRTVTEITATAGQTVFTANGGYTVGYIDVFVNGAQLQNTDFTATNGSSITLNEATQANDVVRLVAWGTFNTSSFQGNLAFTGTGNRILGDFSNATVANRVYFQNSVSNSASVVGVIPNGTSTTSRFAVWNASDPTNSSWGDISATSSEIQVRSNQIGTGSFLPLTMYTSGSERLRIDTSGNVGIGTAPTSYGSTVRNIEAYIAGASGYTLVSAMSASVKTEITASEAGPVGQVGTRSNHALVIKTNDTERMRVTTGGNVGIGTSSPDTRLQVGNSLVGSNATFPGSIQLNESPSSLNQTGGIEFKTSTFGSGYGWKIASIDPGGGTPLLVGFRDNNASWTEALRLDSGGNLRFNSGYGSVATAYGCRAWVNFNGTGTVAIRASGNVSSITDNGTGNYTVNFTNAMPDANYGCHFGFPSFATNDIALNVAVRGTLAGGPNNKTTTAVSILSGRAFNTVLDDLVDIYVAIFR